jgi:Cu/Zn superoxide dismutase
MAVATIAALTPGTITGTVTFVANGADVTVTYALENCPAGVHPTHIHAGTGCASTAEQGLHWAPPRGEGIGGTGTGHVTCTADMKGTLTYTRTGGMPATNWTIGPPAGTNIIGHPLIVHGVNTSPTMENSDRHGCGVIMMK